MRFALFALTAATIAAQSMAPKAPFNVDTRDNNVYFTDAQGQRTQITSSGRDLFPVLSPDARRVAFVRVTAERPEGEEIPLLCVTDIAFGEPAPTCSSVRYQDEEDPLGGFSRPVWSADSRSVYFLADFSTRTRALCRFDLSTGKAVFLAPANEASGELRTIIERITR